MLANTESGIDNSNKNQSLNSKPSSDQEETKRFSSEGSSALQSGWGDRSAKALLGAASRLVFGEVLRRVVEASFHPQDGNVLDYPPARACQVLA